MAPQKVEVDFAFSFSSAWSRGLVFTSTTVSSTAGADVTLEVSLQKRRGGGVSKGWFGEAQPKAEQGKSKIGS